MSMADRDGVIWYDGELVQWRDATTHVLTHTLHYGMGVFEGVRAYNTPDGTAIFRLQAHTDRLFDSAHIMNMPMPYSKEEINEATRAAVRENNLESAYIRPMVFYGSEGMGLRASGLKVHVIVAAWHWGAYMGDEALELGIKVRTSSFTRHHVNITMTRAKSNGAYINSMLALQEAISGGADEALMLDPEGYVAEGSGENIFIIKDGVIYTPEVTACLNGITRGTVLTLAAEHGLKWSRSASPATRCTSPTKPSSPVPPPKSPRSAKWTVAPSVSAVVARSPRSCRKPTSIWSPARPMPTPNADPGQVSLALEAGNA
jgi:branched-chain amino acid aminotransferase, group I